MEGQNVEVVRGVYDAFGKGDVAGVLGAMTGDMEWHVAEGMPYGGIYHGGEEVAQNVFGPSSRTSRISPSRLKNSLRRAAALRWWPVTRAPQRQQETG